MSRRSLQESNFDEQLYWASSQGISQRPPQEQLYWAVSDGNITEVRSLLQRGVSPNTFKDLSGYTSLYWAIIKENVEIVRELLSAGANVESRSIWGETPLIVAAYKGDLQIVKELVEAGANLDHKDKHGTALDNAREEGHKNVAEFLSEKMASVN